MAGKDLVLADLVKESEPMRGALGVMAYAVIKGLQVGGAEHDTLASVRVLMQEHFESISDQDCNTLCDLVWNRLQEEKKKGSWY